MQYSIEFRVYATSPLLRMMVDIVREGRQMCRYVIESLNRIGRQYSNDRSVWGSDEFGFGEAVQWEFPPRTTLECLQVQQDVP